MEQSSMEKNFKCINDLLPLELIRSIFLRIPVKHLARAKCVSKLWNTLISDPSFTKSHLHHSLAPTHKYILIENYHDASSVDLDALLVEDNDGVDEESLSLPFMKKPPSRFCFLGSCRGLVLLHREPQFLILWNPLIDSSKRISYSHMVNAARKDRDSFRSVNKVFSILDDALLYGFGYDASRDDYILVVAYKGKDSENHFDMCCLGSKSWINLDAALPKPMSWFDWTRHGLFCNGAIHWINFYHGEEILLFDLKERTFSKISLPEQLMWTRKSRLVLLGGSLAVYLYKQDKTEIWVMKEYKVQTSWTLYEIPLKLFKPLCLSGDGDIIIGSRYTSHDVMGFYIYNVSGELLKPVQYLYVMHYHASYNVCTDSLMPIPNKIKEKKMKKDHRNHRQVKLGKRIRTDQM
ncbi:hypothetical protein PIB30_054557 [Stylosanthes scabra]|uniref:F-box domain-containing protein n=1 Tax=Stylosanthes scabra TaxID=79078 RepID=A0ABU6SIP5_9FABA|nr:hypothetical protein [Stylosanthes scabra]